MPQFDLCENPNPRSRDWAPYIIDLQHDMLRSLNTRIMAPLLKSQPRDEPMMQRLNPAISIKGREYFLSTAEMDSVPISELSEVVDSRDAHRDELMAAVDLLFTAV